MIDAAEDTPSKISTGYSTPQIAIAVVIAVAIHAAFVGSMLLSAAGKAPEAAATAAGPAKPAAADANAKPLAVTADPKDTGKPKANEDGLGPDSESKATNTDTKKDKGSDKVPDSVDELKMDTK